MLTTIKGYYEQGQIYFNEELPFTTKAEVIITFLSEQPVTNNNKERVPGGLKGKVSIPDDFNEPLEDINDYM